MRVFPAFLRERGVATEGHPYNYARLPLFVACLCFFLPIQLVQAQDQETKPAVSNVGGQVVYADTGRPLRHANLILTSVELRWNNLMVASDNNGRFLFENVPAGHYILTIDSLNILRSGFPEDGQSLLNHLRLGEMEFATQVFVTGNNHVERKIKAERGGVITGRVVDEEGDPVDDVDVKLLKRENGKWEPDLSTWFPTGSFEARLKTDDTGTYRITGLLSGDYVLRVSESSETPNRRTTGGELYGEGSLMVAYHPAASKIKDAQVVSVVQGQETSGVDVRLSNHALYLLSGIVTFGRGNDPVKYVDLHILRKEEAEMGGNIHNVTVRTDQDGKWNLDGVPDGEYVINVRSVAREGMSSTPKIMNLRVAGSDVTGIDIKLTRGATITGRVAVEGKPSENLPRRTASLVPANDRSNANQSANARYDGYLDREGGFEIAGVPAGKYWFRMLATEDGKFYVKAVTRRGVNLLNSPIELAEGSAFDGLEVTLSMNLARIEGTVGFPEAAKTKAVRDVVVILVPANDLTRRFSNGLSTALLDEQGRFSFDCAPGEYFVTAMTSSQIGKRSSSLTAEFLKQNNVSLVRVKVDAGEKAKGLTVTVLEGTK